MRNLLLAVMACTAMLAAAGSAGADVRSRNTCGKNNTNLYADASTLTHNADWKAVLAIDCGNGALYQWEIQVQAGDGSWSDLYDEQDYYFGATVPHTETFHIGGIGCDNSKNYRLKAYDYWGGSWAAWSGGC